MVETYTSLQQEVEIKTKKLKKVHRYIFRIFPLFRRISLYKNDFYSVSQLFAKLQSTKAEIQDVQEEHVRERQELEQTQNELTRELKLKWVLRFCTLYHLPNKC